MNETRRSVHLPGLRAPRGTAASARRTAAELLRSRGAQRVDRPPGTPAARARAFERNSGGSVMANEAYRAVFLRVHPTGKMVLSLTTESDGKESHVRAAGRRRARRAGARRQGRPRRREPVRVTGTASTPARPAGRRRRSASATGKIRAKAQLLAGMALETPADELQWDNGAFVGGATGPSRTIADIALYAHGSGALPPGVEGGLDAQTVYATDSDALKTAWRSRLEPTSSDRRTARLIGPDRQGRGGRQGGPRPA